MHSNALSYFILFVTVAAYTRDDRSRFPCCGDRNFNQRVDYDANRFRDDYKYRPKRPNYYDYKFPPLPHHPGSRYMERRIFHHAKEGNGGYRPYVPDKRNGYDDFRRRNTYRPGLLQSVSVRNPGVIVAVGPDGVKHVIHDLPPWDDKQSGRPLPIDHRGSGIEYSEPPRGAEVEYSEPPRGAEVEYPEPPRGAGIEYSEPPRGAGIEYSEPPRGAGIEYSEPPRGAGIEYSEPPRGSEAEYSKPPRGYEIEYSKHPGAKTEYSKPSRDRIQYFKPAVAKIEFFKPQSNEIEYSKPPKGGEIVYFEPPRSNGDQTEHLSPGFHKKPSYFHIHQTLKAGPVSVQGGLGSVGKDSIKQVNPPSHTKEEDTPATTQDFRPSPQFYRYSEPDPLYHPNGSPLQTYPTETTTTPKPPQYPDSINAQLPPPTHNTDTRVPYVTATQASEATQKKPYTTAMQQTSVATQASEAAQKKSYVTATQETSVATQASDATQKKPYITATQQTSAATQASEPTQKESYVTVTQQTPVMTQPSETTQKKPYTTATQQTPVATRASEAMEEKPLVRVLVTQPPTSSEAPSRLSEIETQTSTPYPDTTKIFLPTIPSYPIESNESPAQEQPITTLQVETTATSVSMVLKSGENQVEIKKPMIIVVNELPTATVTDSSTTTHVTETEETTATAAVQTADHTTSTTAEDTVPEETTVPPLLGQLHTLVNHARTLDYISYFALTEPTLTDEDEWRK